MSEYIIQSINGAVLSLSIARPKVKNALTMEMYQALADGLDRAVQDESIHVVLLTGSDGSFTSGNDLNDFQKLVDLDDPQNGLLQFMYKLAACPKAVVAAVDGVAVGIGTTLLMHCDFVYASPQANFSLPFVSLGLCPEYASSLLLPRIVGLRKANEMLMLGRPLNAQEAVTAGLINEVQDDVLAYAQKIAKHLAGQAPDALRQTKALLKSSKQLQLEDVIAEEIDVFKALLQGPEFAEAAAAFFEKRQADFSRLQ